MILASALGLIGYALWSTEAQRAETAAGGPGAAGISSMEGSTVDTSVKGHKVIAGGGIDNYALTLPVVLEAARG